MSARITFEQALALAGSGNADAQYALSGNFHRQGLHEQSRYWLERAVALGHGQAQQTLALLGLNADSRDLARSRELFALAAAQGLASAAYYLAELFGFAAYRMVDEEQSSAHLLTAARGGYGPALRLLALRAHANGELEASAALFDAAARTGDTQALHALGLCYWRGLGVSANTSYTAAAFHAAASAPIPMMRSRTYLGQLNGVKPLPPPALALDWPALMAARSFAYQSHTLQPATSLHIALNIVTHEDVLTEIECDYLINHAAPLVQRSMIVDAGTGEVRADPMRTSSHVTLGPLQHDLFIEAVEQRISQYNQIAPENGEFCQILRYRPGEEFRPHVDYFNEDGSGAYQSLADGGQRRQTSLIYLNDDFEGGATEFSKLGLKVPPQRGALLLFNNVDANGRGDRASLHAGTPVLQGEKWLLSKWSRDRAYPPRATW